MMMFFVYATAATLIIRRPLLDRVLVVLGGVPITITAYVTRIVMTGLLDATVGGKMANIVYHDLPVQRACPGELLVPGPARGYDRLIF